MKEAAIVAAAVAVVFMVVTAQGHRGARGGAAPGDTTVHRFDAGMSNVVLTRVSRAHFVAP